MTTAPPAPIRAIVAILLVGIIGFAAAACGGSDDAGPEEPTYSFVIPAGSADRIEQGEVTRHPAPRARSRELNETIVIVNEDDEAHQLGPWFVGAGETLRQRFTTAGVFEDACIGAPLGQVHRRRRGVTTAGHESRPSVDAVTTPTILSRPRCGGLHGRRLVVGRHPSRRRVEAIAKPARDDRAARGRTARRPRPHVDVARGSSPGSRSGWSATSRCYHGRPVRRWVVGVPRRAPRLRRRIRGAVGSRRSGWWPVVAGLTGPGDRCRPSDRTLPCDPAPSISGHRLHRRERCGRALRRRHGSSADRARHAGVRRLRRDPRCRPFPRARPATVAVWIHVLYQLGQAGIVLGAIVA